MKKAYETENQGGNEHSTSLERYLLMNEKEKDAEIQKAIVRLQNRIQEILYMLESDKTQIAGLGDRSRDKKNRRK